MKSVGEVMAIGRTFAQAFPKALRSRELDEPPRLRGTADAELLRSLQIPGPDRYEAILELFSRWPISDRSTMEEIHALTRIDPWFLRELQALARDPQAPFAARPRLSPGAPGAPAFP